MTETAVSLFWHSSMNFIWSMKAKLEQSLASMVVSVWHLVCLRKCEAAPKEALLNRGPSHGSCESKISYVRGV